MTTFIAAALLLALAAAAAVFYGPRLHRRSGAGVSQARMTAAALREQLTELESERARGLLDDAEFRRLRDELQRRLLAEVAVTVPVAGAVAQPRRALLAYALALPVAALLLYGHFGRPQLLRDAGAPMPAEAAAQAAGGDQWLLQLESHVAASPGDARAWVMLARARMQRDQFEPAAFAYRKALDASSKVARDPLIWCEYADALGMTQGGRLAGEPRRLIDHALTLDAAHPRALEMAGSAAYEAGDFRAAARYWRQLLTLLAPDTAEHAQLAAAIARAEQRAQFRLPAS